MFELPRDLPKDFFREHSKMEKKRKSVCAAGMQGRGEPLEARRKRKRTPAEYYCPREVGTGEIAAWDTGGKGNERIFNQEEARQGSQRAENTPRMAPAMN